jgi:hypothetical protein
MKKSEMLKAAKDLISTPDTWTQCAFARDDNGTELYSGAMSGACKWCSMGAIEYVLSVIPSYESLEHLRNELNFQAGEQHLFDVTAFNDHVATTHDQVMDLFNRAIVRAQRNEQ